MKIAHIHQRFFRVAAGIGHNGRADFLQPIVQAQGAGKHSVAKGYLHNILISRPRGHNKARHAVRPHFKIVFGIAYDCRLTCCAGGGMDAHNLFHRLGKQAKWVIIAQVSLRSGRNVLDIRKGLDFIRRNARLVQLFGVEGHIAVAVIYRPFQAFQLKRL